MTSIELYLKALTRVSDRHFKEETCRRNDWKALNRVYTDSLVGDLEPAEVKNIFANVR